MQIIQSFVKLLNFYGKSEIENNKLSQSINHVYSATYSGRLGTNIATIEMYKLSLSVITNPQ